MEEIKIKLTTIEQVKNFAFTVGQYPYDVDVVQERYSVDAKSIIGLFSLDLTKSLAVRIYGDGHDDLKTALREYISEDAE